MFCMMLSQEALVIEESGSEAAAGQISGDGGIGGNET